MRKLWVKAWITLDGVFDADTMKHRWNNTNSPERMRHITEEYAKGDAYLLGRKTYEMLWPAGPTRRPAMVLGRSSIECTNTWSPPRSQKLPGRNTPSSQGMPWKKSPN